MAVFRIFSSEELAGILEERGGTLVRLADNMRLEVASHDDKTHATELLFENGRTCAQVEAR